MKISDRRSHRFPVARTDRTASKREQRAARMCVRGTRQAHTDGDMPELLLKSPASSPQDYRCQQNCTSDRTYYDIGAAGTCGIEIEILFNLPFFFSPPPPSLLPTPLLFPFCVPLFSISIVLSIQTTLALPSLSLFPTLHFTALHLFCVLYSFFLFPFIEVFLYTPIISPSPTVVVSRPFHFTLLSFLVVFSFSSNVHSSFPPASKSPQQSSA